MTQPKIILLTGLADAGKSTAGEYLRRAHDFYIIKFANGIKNCMYSLGLTEEEVEGALKEVPCDKLMGKTPRYAMQTLGTEWGRGFMGMDFWVHAAVREVREFQDCFSDPINVVFDDCRFPNEIDLMKEAFEDVTVIHLVPAYEGYQPIKESEHESENQTLDWDIAIENRDISQLEGDIDAYLSGDL